MDQIFEEGKTWRILAVDDEPEVLEGYEAILSAMGHLQGAHEQQLDDLNQLMNADLSQWRKKNVPRFELQCAESGELGYHKVMTALNEHRPYAVIYLDMRMPNGWDGLETAIRVREVDPHVRIIIVTAYADHSLSDIRSKIGVGFEFLTKPIHREELSQLTLLHIEQWERDIELQRYRKELEQLVEARTHALQEEVDQHKRTAQALEQSNRYRSEFVANMGHELRTPMNGILGLNDLLLRSPVSEEQRGYLETQRESAQQLMKLLNELLDVSQLESGTMEISERPFDLEELFQQLEYHFKTVLAVDQSITLQRMWDEGVPSHLRGDGSHLMQILTHLCSNAVKFSEQGEVVIAVTATESTISSHCLLHFAVIDQGCGMSEAQQQEIFELFVQGDGSLTRQQGGTGMGLAICQRLVLLMGGEPMAVESREGHGSIFSFSLPFEVVPAFE